MIRVGVAVSAFAAFFSFAALASEPAIDFEGVNSNISEALKPVVAEFDHIKAFSYAFDPRETDVEAGKYKAAVILKADAPWSKDGSEQIDAHGSIALKKMGDDAGKVAVKIEADVNTDTLAFVRHAATYWASCPAAEELTGAMRIARVEDCKIVPRLRAVQSIDDLFVIMQDHLKDTEMSLSRYTKELDATLSSAKDEEVRHLLQQNLKVTHEILAAVRNVTLERTKDGMHLKVGKFSFCSFFSAEEMEWILTADRLHFAGQVATKFGAKIFDLTKPDMHQFLGDLANGEEYAERLIQLDARIWLRVISEVLKAPEATRD